MAGTAYGFKQGYENYAVLEKILAGGLFSAYAERSHDPTQENIDSVRWYLEFQVDQGLDSYIHYEESGNKLLSKLFLKEHLELFDKSGKLLANYRNKWPETKIPDEGWEEEWYSDYEVRFESRRELVERLQADL